MKIRTCIKIAMMVAVLSFIWGCGGGGGGGNGAPGAATNGKVVSKTSLLGTINPDVRGIEITLVLPAGVTVATDPAYTDGRTASGVVAIPGNSLNAANVSTLQAKYTPASSSSDNKGRLKIGVFSSKSFVADDNFLSIECDVEAGKTVTAGDFSCEGAKAFDSKGTEVPATWSVTVNGSTVSGGTATALQKNLAAGLYDSTFRTYSGVSAYAIKNIALGSDGSSLTETWSYWDKSSKTWSATLPAGIPVNMFGKSTQYFLTASGWVSGTSGPQGYTIVFNTDETATITSKSDGSTAKISVTTTDISGLAASTALADSSEALFPLVASTPVLPAGSVRYTMVFNQLADSYRTRDYDSIGSTIINLSDVPAVFSEGNSTSRKIYIDNNFNYISYYALFASGSTVNIYKQDISATATTSLPVLIGTASWAYKTVSGQQLLLITIPSALRSDYKLGWDPFFAVVNGVVMLGDYAIGGQTSYSNGGTSYNKVVADYMVANFSLAATGTAVAKAISRAILGF